MLMLRQTNFAFVLLFVTQIEISFIGNREAHKN